MSDLLNTLKDFDDADFVLGDLIKFVHEKGLDSEYVSRLQELDKTQKLFICTIDDQHDTRMSFIVMAQNEPEAKRFVSGNIAKLGRSIKAWKCQRQQGNVVAMSGMGKR